MSDGKLWGYKQIAAALGRSIRSTIDQTNLSRDPLRVNRLRGKVWMTATGAEAWRRRHSSDRTGLVIVETWEGIAKTIEVPIRTAQRWASEADDPLPVERPDGGVVFAYRDALLDWLNGQMVRAGTLRGGPTTRDDVCPPAAKKKARAA